MYSVNKYECKYISKYYIFFVQFIWASLQSMYIVDSFEYNVHQSQDLLKRIDEPEKDEKGKKEKGSECESGDFFSIDAEHKKVN